MQINITVKIFSHYHQTGKQKKNYLTIRVDKDMKEL